MVDGGAAVCEDGESGGDRTDRLLLGLVARVHAGERAALAEVLAVVRPLVLRYARNRLRPARDAFVSVEDVVQETCLALVKAIPAYRSDGRPFMAFAYAIAYKKIADVYRTSSRDRSSPVWEFADRPDGLADPEQRLLDRERGDRAGALVAALPVAQREVLFLRLMVGLSAVETAQVLGTTPGAVRVAQHRALTALRRKLR